MSTHNIGFVRNKKCQYFLVKKSASFRVMTVALSRSWMEGGMKAGEALQMSITTYTFVEK